MPFEQQVFVAVLAIVATLIVIWLSLRKPGGTNETLGDEADLDSKYRDGPTLRYGRDTPRAEDLRRDMRSSFHPMPGPQETFHGPVPITLTPRHLEHVNILRRRDGKPPLSAKGFRAAIANQIRAAIANQIRAAIANQTAASQSQLNTSEDWLTYLIMYEVLFFDQQQSRVAVDHTFIIPPDAPFNGQGGEFAGAGATSSSNTPVTDPLADRDGLPATRGLTYVADAELGKDATQGMAYGSAGGFAAALGAGAALAGADPGPKQVDPSDGGPEAYSPPAAAPEPAPAPQPVTQPDPPAYSAPDPAPSGTGD